MRNALADMRIGLHILPINAGRNLSELPDSTGNLRRSSAPGLFPNWPTTCTIPVSSTPVEAVCDPIWFSVLSF